MPSAPPNGGWKTKVTVDGGTFYHNIVTDAVSWEKPPELQTAEERQTDSSDCVWLPVSTGGWVPATVVQRTAKHIKARPIGGGADVDVPLTGKNAVALDPVKLSHLEPRAMHEDLVLLESLTPALIAHCLRKRFETGEIYTWVGADHTVLISINPFERLPLYGPALLSEFAAPAPNRLLPPHTYAIGAAAFTSMRASRLNQVRLPTEHARPVPTVCSL
jgi:myosin heavy subunit